MSNALLDGLAALPVPPSHTPKVFGAIERDNFSMWKDRDVRSFFDPPNQIGRHSVFQPVCFNHHENMLCGFSQKQCRLTGRTPPANDACPPAFALVSLDKRCTAIDSNPFKP